MFAEDNVAVITQLKVEDRTQKIGISWSLYCDARYNPTSGIEIEFTHKRVFIRGQDLLQLYHSILGNRVTYIAEADRPTAKLHIVENECVVTELIVDNQKDAT